MIKKIIYIFTVLLFSFQLSSAQSNAQAENILSNLLNTAKKEAIRTNFKLIASDKSNPQGMSSSGTFTLKGTKFVLDMSDMKAWFDGKTQWAYVSQSNEVSITEPSEKELSETNPMAILSGYKTKCIIRFSTKVKSAQNHCIEMIPKVKNKDIVKIDVEVNKITGNLYSIKLTNRNGSVSTLILSNFQKGIRVEDNIFVFNKAKYKGVVINDLR
ncbi:MAG: outer membrane lipoprotein carrier protein LolA [Paludibacter sp.]|nr:outer membrane lipoprotein carrier protein LolA [Paludibacter sp.]